MTLDDLQSISGFDQYEQFIRKFILEDINLWKLIFYPYSDVFSDPRAVDPENPYGIFTRDIVTNEDGTTLDTHGVVLFDDKDDTILNSNNVTVLVSYESTRLGNSYFCDSNYIIFQIICKGSSIKKLANGKDRTEAICEFIDNNFNLAKVNKIGEIHRQSFSKLNLSSENIGHTLIYKCRNLSSHLLDNKNYLKKNYGVDSRENI